MKYIKFDEYGMNAYEAHSTKKTENGTIFGYNHESNEAMLLADGWLKYEGDLPVRRLIYSGGEIVEMPEPEVEPTPNTKFTKLQIRRCLREHGYEDVLDNILSSNYVFKKEWDDCLDIDLNDPMMKQAIEGGLIPQELVTLIQNECSGTYI